MKICVKQQRVYQQRELSTARKTSHEHNDKDPYTGYMNSAKNVHPQMGPVQRCGQK